MKILSPEEIKEAFIHSNLEENYNFLMEDLDKLAHSFIAKAKDKLVAAERAACIDVARSYNTLVADKIKEIREKV